MDERLFEMLDNIITYHFAGYIRLREHEENKEKEIVLNTRIELEDTLRKFSSLLDSMDYQDSLKEFFREFETKHEEYIEDRERTFDDLVADDVEEDLIKEEREDIENLQLIPVFMSKVETCK